MAKSCGQPIKWVNVLKTWLCEAVYRFINMSWLLITWRTFPPSPQFNSVGKLGAVVPNTWYSYFSVNNQLFSLINQSQGLAAFVWWSVPIIPRSGAINHAPCYQRHMTDDDSSQRTLWTWTEENHHSVTIWQPTLQQQSGESQCNTNTHVSDRPATKLYGVLHAKGYFSLQRQEEWRRAERKRGGRRETASRKNLPVGNCIWRWGWALEGEGTSVEEREGSRKWS